MPRTFPLEGVIELVDAFERMASEAGDLARVAEREATKHSYEMYHRFREKVRELDALHVLVDERLNNIEGGRNAEVERRYNAAAARLLATQVRASLRFFYVLSANTFLPVGSREIFLTELAHLELTNQSLADARFAPFVEDVSNELETAREILSEIVDKAPGMLDLARAQLASTR
jgi:hypothetical protein